MKKLLIAAALALACILPMKAKADVQAEVFPNSENVTVDAKASTAPGPVKYFMRNRMTVEYDGTAKNFNLQELSFGKAFRGGVQARLFNLDLVPQVGISYFHDFGDVKVFDALSMSISSEPMGENLLSVSYNPEGFRPDHNWQIELENINWFNQEQFSGTDRLHVGYKIGPVSFGAAGEIDYGTQRDLDWRVGGYLRFSN